MTGRIRDRENRQHQVAMVFTDFMFCKSRLAPSLSHAGIWLSSCEKAIIAFQKQSRARIIELKQLS